MFEALRIAMGGEPREADLRTKEYDDELDQMTEADGLRVIEQFAGRPPPTRRDPPEYDAATMGMASLLWVVRPADAVSAPEFCNFGYARGRRRVKHSNLTGGAAAYIGGELLQVGTQEILMNGCSGRYKPLAKAEIDEAARAFVRGGYRVWCTGYDSDAGYCYKFGAGRPYEVTDAV